MLLFGCLLAFAASIAPRLVLLFAWLFSDRWDLVWGGQWFWALMGIIFLPYTTIMYVLTWSVLGIHGWEWMWVLLGLMLDVMKYAQIANNRKGIPAYPGGEPLTGTPAA